MVHEFSVTFLLCGQIILQRQTEIVLKMKLYQINYLVYKPNTLYVAEINLRMNMKVSNIIIDKVSKISA